MPLDNIGGPIVSDHGIRFPQLYRAQGYYCFDDMPEAEGKQDELTPIWYTLDPKDTGPFKNIHRVAYTPITGFDPQIDNGWIWVRLHRSAEQAEGYSLAISDFGPLSAMFGGDSLNKRIFATSDGVFTLVTCSPRRDCEDHLVIYANEYNAAADQLGGDDWDFEYVVVKSDGTEVREDDILYP